MERASSRKRAKASFRLNSLRRDMASLYSAAYLVYTTSSASCNHDQAQVLVQLQVQEQIQAQAQCPREREREREGVRGW